MKTEVDPWCVLEGSNRTFLISNRAAIHPKIIIDFDVKPQSRKIAERDAWTIAEALNNRDSALRAPAAEKPSSSPDWGVVAASLFSHGDSIDKVNPTASSVLLFLSWALRDGLEAASKKTKGLGTH